MAVVHVRISRVMLLLADLLIRQRLPLSFVLPLIGDFLSSNLGFFELRGSFQSSQSNSRTDPVLLPARWQANRIGVNVKR
jgi:hypothetical protein